MITADAPFDALKLLEYLTWLVGHAVGLSYEDRAAAINEGAAAELEYVPATGAAAAASTAPAVVAAEVTPAVASAVRELAAMLHVQTEGRTSLQVLQAAHRIIRQRLLPAVALTSTDGSGGEGPRSKAAALRRAGTAAAVAASPATAEKQLLEVQFPLGFSLGSEVVDRAAAILRMLYIADLRELQDAVNDILVTIQEYTANPKTDAALGKVGR